MLLRKVLAASTFVLVALPPVAVAEPTQLATCTHLASTATVLVLSGDATTRTVTTAAYEANAGADQITFSSSGVFAPAPSLELHANGAFPPRGWPALTFTLDLDAAGKGTFTQFGPGGEDYGTVTVVCQRNAADCEKTYDQCVDNCAAGGWGTAYCIRSICEPALDSCNAGAKL